MKNISDLDCELKNTISQNGKVGLILLATDQITLYEFENIFKGISILFFPTRVMNSSKITQSELVKIKDELSNATKVILPHETLDVVAFSCTAASMIIGGIEVEKTIKQSGDDREIKSVTNPFSAVKNACSFLNIDKVGLITPYEDELTNGIIKGMENEKISVEFAASFKMPNDNLVPNIMPSSIMNAAIKMAKNENIENIFISCTNLNICNYIDELEKVTGKTILTSNQAMAWDILRLSNYKKPIIGFGKLLEKSR